MKVPGLRSSYEKVGGIVYFGRMLDKIRLHAAGRLPDGYNLGTKVWTWFDARCTRFLAVNYEALVERVLSGGTDEEILAWCFEHGRRPGEEDIEIWNDFMIKRGWRDSSSAVVAEAKRLRGFAHRDDIQTAFEFHLADESSDDTPAADVGRHKGGGVPTLSTIELKAFIPAKDFELSKRFYQDVGFFLASDTEGVAYFHHANVSFLLQNFYVKELAENLMMHLLVESVDSWWNAILEAKIAEKYGVRVTAVEQTPWRMRDFVLFDPSGVLWRIAENTH